MEASLLVAPKPPLLFSATRGGLTRRCIVAGAFGRGKIPMLNIKRDLEARPQGRSNDVQQAASNEPGAHGLFAMAATAVTMSSALPCHASPPSQEIMHRALMVVGDLDPATAKVAIGVTGPALSAFGFLFIMRIVMSWYPKLPVTEFPYVVAYAPTEPFLAVTRKVIPPLGGVDVTPVVWFGLVSFLNEILAGPQGLLVLLSRQV